MRERIRGWAARVWRGVLLNGIGALAIAALATLACADGIAHSAGALAWCFGLAGAVLGLIAGEGREVSS